MTQKEALAIIDHHLAALGEHFEAVQIMATSCDGEGTRIVSRGSGNFYARKGMAQTFLERDHAEEQAHYIKEALHPDDE